MNKGKLVECIAQVILDYDLQNKTLQHDQIAEDMLKGISIVTERLGLTEAIDYYLFNRS